MGLQTVFDDNVIDRLTGSLGIDWFLLNSVADNSSAKDVVTELNSDELDFDSDFNLF